MPKPTVQAPGTVQLYTLDISDGNPVTINPRVIDVIDTRNDSFPNTKSVNHFPDKFANMNKRRLRLGTVPYLPNAFIEDKVSTMVVPVMSSLN